MSALKELGSLAAHSARLEKPSELKQKLLNPLLWAAWTAQNINISLWSSNTLFLLNVGKTDIKGFFPKYFAFDKKGKKPKETL